MTLQNMERESKANTKHREEENQVNQFMDYYQRSTGMKYLFKCRPEDKTKPNSKGVNGTHDYEFVPENGQGLTLAIELGGIYMSEADVRDTAIHCNFIGKLRGELSKELPPGEYILEIDTNRNPSRNEAVASLARVVELLKNMIMASGSVGIRETAVKRFKLNDTLRITCSIHIAKLGKRNLNILSSRTEGYGESISDEASSDALIKVILDNDWKLAIPRREGKKTVLLAVNSYEGRSFPEPQKMKHAVQSRLGLHSNIDEIYLLNPRMYKDGFDVERIK